jgi:hypothetical protein
MTKTQPPNILKPKDPTPTWKDFVLQNDSQLRCYNKVVRSELLRDLSSTARDQTDQIQLDAVDNVRILDTSTDVDEDYNFSKNQTKASIMAARIYEDQRRSRAFQAKMRKSLKAKDENFMARYERLHLEQSTFVAELDRYLENQHTTELQKKRALHREWKECVFDKIQAQILHRVEDMDPERIAARRRALLQRYLDAARSTGARLFLDIVVETEYDPFVWRKDTLRYRAKPATASHGPGFTDRVGNPAHDPTTRDLDKRRAEARAARAAGPGPHPPDAGRLGRETLGQEHWALLQATPFFDHAAQALDAAAAGRAPPPPPPPAAASAVRLDDFEFPRGGAAPSREFRAFYGKGKRVWPGRAQAAREPSPP